jgi:hypothetical protein
MARKADEGWVSRNGKPVHIPPYKAPRQKTTKGKDETRMSERVIEVLDSEDKGKGDVESDSEEDTQLGLVWGSPGIPETELQGSDVDEDNIPFSELREKKRQTNHLCSFQRQKTRVVKQSNRQGLSYMRYLQARRV